MRILAIDFGTKRVGLAVSDETRTIAQSLDVITYESKRELYSEIAKIKETHRISEIILGNPLNLR